MFNSREPPGVYQSGDQSKREKAPRQLGPFCLTFQVSGLFLFETQLVNRDDLPISIR
jgi:hypothetical protein